MKNKNKYKNLDIILLVLAVIVYLSGYLIKIGFILFLAVSIPMWYLRVRLNIENASIPGEYQ